LHATIITLEYRNLPSNIACAEQPIVAVIGTGSIGRRHLENLQALGANAIACSRTAGRQFVLSNGVTISATTDYESVIRSADAIVVATPTDEHLALALQIAKAKKALFIEKPLSHNLDGIAELKRASLDVVVEVGCQLRAHPGLQTFKSILASGVDGPVLAFRGCVGQRLDKWRPGTDYRVSYSADRERGGGALFDLVHEVDLALWLCGPFSGIFARLSNVSDLQLKADDLANLILETADGACGNLQLDMISPAYRRTFEVICERASYEWNYVRGVLTRNTEQESAVVFQIRDGFDRNELFLAHMRHFLARVRGEVRNPLCSLSDGIADMFVLAAANESARSGKWTSIRAEF
jgi:predicted dehydrogenase